MSKSLLSVNIPHQRISFSRGFAFVVFKTIQGLQDAVSETEHAVKGKKVAVKKAKAKEGKIYVGKLKPELSDDEIKNHFAQFGQITAVEDFSNIFGGLLAFGLVSGRATI